MPGVVSEPLSQRKQSICRAPWKTVPVREGEFEYRIKHPREL
jgi:hypothetical protein